MLATVTGFRTLGNTAATIDRMTDRIDEVRSVSAFLRDALENSVVGAVSGGGDALGFGGNSANAPPSAFFRVAEDSLEWRAKILFGEAYGGGHFCALPGGVKTWCCNGRTPGAAISRRTGRMRLIERCWTTWRCSRSGHAWTATRHG